MMERRRERKWFWVWEFEKEEAWLNRMAESGWVLDKVGFCKYEFIRCEPGAYAVRLEMHEADEAYIAFMEETGAEYIGRVMQWVFFRKKLSDGLFDLFSDIDSRLEHLNKIARVGTGVTLANVAIGIANSINPVSLGWINLLCAALTAYGAGRIRGKMDELRKERQLHE